MYRTFGDCGKKKTTCGLLAKALRGDFFSRVSFSGRRRFFSLRREKELSDAALFYFDIVMYVNSPGGSVTAAVSFLGMAVFDTMRHIRPDVSTVCVGLAAR
ncbi:hypothetical protein BHM03_00049812 [Ensete ventricosum]|nr:hypothetical protein BHM03_00049812 [Ensete ventricosum]